MRRAVVIALERADEALDEVLYRPAVVKATLPLPRWWRCDLAKFSVWLDDLWHVGYWDEDSIVPGSACDACGRRAAIHVYGGDDPDDDDPPDDLLAHQPVYLCGWCSIRGPVLTADDLRRELDAARAYSVAWRWRWSVR
jgi:hypothetical protein